jgi:hypothetical protein
LSSSDNPQFEPQPPLSAEQSASLTPSPVLSASDFAPTNLAPVPAGLPPVENPVWSGWDVLLIAVLTFVTMLVLQVVVIVGALWLVYPHSTFGVVAQKPILLLLSQFLIYIAVALCMAMLVEGKYHAPFWQAIRWNWPRSEWKLLALGALMMMGLAMLESLLPMPKDTPF